MDIPIWLILFAILIVVVAIVTAMILVRNLILSKIMGTPMDHITAPKIFAQAPTPAQPEKNPDLEATPVPKTQIISPQAAPEISSSPIPSGVNEDIKRE